MRVVVTGALGHIGSRLVRDQTRMLPGTPVVLLDNLMTQRFCSLFDLPSEGDYRFVEADILECDMDALLGPGDVVVHLAAITDAANSFKNAAQVEEVNYAGTERVARACAARGCRLVFLSTTSVYGTQEAEVDEACPPSDLKPQSPYAESKLRAEKTLEALGRERGLRFVTFRFGTIFGVSPGMRFHTAINKFVWQACMGQPITIWRTAMDQQRPYLDLGDAVRAIGFAVEKDLFAGETYNVLTLNTTPREIVAAIRRHVADLQVELVDSRIMNQLSYRVSSRKFGHCGFAFRGDLDEGIGASVARLATLAKARNRGEGTKP